MKKYVTRTQRRERRIKKIKLITIAISTIAIVFIMAFIGLSIVIHFHKNKYNSEEVLQNTEYTDEIVIPEYYGEDYIILNNGMPCFSEWDKKNIEGEHYSQLDNLGRCGPAYALLDKSMMPTEERKEIGQIKPSGWVQKKYEGIIQSEPPYLYNRCHLIAYALTGQNDNELNLITGTRYMNASTMLPWEERVMKYLDDSGNHVLYRVTPHFKENELLARGVEMEAYSVEDQGASLCFHVFVYNIQPGIELDYSTGESQIKIELK